MMKQKWLRKALFNWLSAEVELSNKNCQQSINISLFHNAINIWTFYPVHVNYIFPENVFIGKETSNRAIAVIEPE